MSASEWAAVGGTVACAVALIALSVAAVYPVLIELSGVLAAENLLTVLVLAAVWAALRARRSPHPIAWLAAAGVLTGLATLTHQTFSRDGCLTGRWTLTRRSTAA